MAYFTTYMYLFSIWSTDTCTADGTSADSEDLAQFFFN